MAFAISSTADNGTVPRITSYGVTFLYFLIADLRYSLESLVKRCDVNGDISYRNILLNNSGKVARRRTLGYVSYLSCFLMSWSNCALVCCRHLVKNALNFIDHRRSSRTNCKECLCGHSREQKLPWRECTVRHHYIKNASLVPWTDRVNHERSLEFRVWFSWDRSKERENLGERCQRFML